MLLKVSNRSFIGSSSLDFAYSVSRKAIARKIVLLSLLLLSKADTGDGRSVVKVAALKVAGNVERIAARNGSGGKTQSFCCFELSSLFSLLVFGICP